MPKTTPHKKSIDVGLAVLETVWDGKEVLSRSALAEVCECSEQNIYYIEKRALDKLRKQFISRGVRL